MTRFLRGSAAHEFLELFLRVVTVACRLEQILFLLQILFSCRLDQIWKRIVETKIATGSCMVGCNVKLNRITSWSCRLGMIVLRICHREMPMPLLKLQVSSRWERSPIWFSGQSWQVLDLTVEYLISNSLAGEGTRLWIIFQAKDESWGVRPLILTSLQILDQSRVGLRASVRQGISSYFPLTI